MEGLTIDITLAAVLGLLLAADVTEYVVIGLAVETAECDALKLSADAIE